MNDPQTKLHSDVIFFLEVYNVLSPEGRAQFEAQMLGELKDKDEKTKRLYFDLLKSAKDKLKVDEAIEGLNKTNASSSSHQPPFSL
jgi:hypothetical protein